jgi:hypothetical protein
MLLLVAAIPASRDIPRSAAQPQTIGFFIVSNSCSRCNITLVNSTLTQTHYNNTFASLDKGVYNITANAPSGFAFQSWSVRGYISVSSSTSNPSKLFVTGSGNLYASFIAMTTLTCGSSSCAVASNATIAQILWYSDNHTLIADLSGPKDTVGFSNATVPKSDVYNSNLNSITVYQNGTLVPSSQLTITSNATDFFVYFTFTFHSGVRAEYVFFPLQAQSLPIYLGITVALLAFPVVISARSRVKNRRLSGL